LPKRSCQKSWPLWPQLLLNTCTCTALRSCRKSGSIRWTRFALKAPDLLDMDLGRIANTPLWILRRGCAQRTATVITLSLPVLVVVRYIPLWIADGGGHDNQSWLVVRCCSPVVRKALGLVDVLLLHNINPSSKASGLGRCESMVLNKTCPRHRGAMVSPQNSGLLHRPKRGLRCCSHHRPRIQDPVQGNGHAHSHKTQQ